MIAYILSNTNLTIKDVVSFDQYVFASDIDCAGKSYICLTKKPNITDDDFVICKNDAGETIYTGVCENYTTCDSEGYTVNLLQPECFFDRTIFVGSESIILATGIEDFIVSEINANWVSSGDTLLDKSYLIATAQSHNIVNAKVSSISSVSNSCYNLKTFLGNVNEKYGIKIRFVFGAYSDIVNENSAGIVNEQSLNLVVPTRNGSNKLYVAVYKDSATTAKLAVDVSEVSAFEETYDVDVLAKLNVKWLNTSTSTTTYPVYYLKTDRTITTNSADPDRAEGVVSALYVESGSQAEMYESVSKEFQSNSYNHKISLSLLKNSKAYPHSDFYVGRNVQIKTKVGVKNTIVTGTEESSDSAFINLVFGKLKVTLIEKLRSL